MGPGANSFIVISFLFMKRCIGFCFLSCPHNLRNLFILCITVDIDEMLLLI